MKVFSKLKSLFRKERLDAEMTEELRLHLEMQTERNIAAGMEPDEGEDHGLNTAGKSHMAAWRDCVTHWRRLAGRAGHPVSPPTDK